ERRVSSVPWPGCVRRSNTRCAMRVGQTLMDFLGALRQRPRHAADRLIGGQHQLRPVAVEQQPWAAMAIADSARWLVCRAVSALFFTEGLSGKPDSRFNQV
ncbi:MAG: hypothetical protein ABI887_17855, partial [Burkholderiales bacterium]